MHTLNPSETHPHFIPTVFPRHNRFLHANQAWLCVHDLGRLMGRALGAAAALARFGVDQVAGYAGSGAGAATGSDHGHLPLKVG